MTRQVTVSFTYDEGSSKAEIYAWRDRVQRGLLALATEFIDKITAWMRTHRPWTDRTTLARRSLGVMVRGYAKKVTMVFYGKAPYQMYLETMQAGRFAIVGPALHYWYGVVVAEMRRRFGGRRV